MWNLKLKTHADFNDVRVYWCVKQFGLNYLGNHHFLAFITRGVMPQVPAARRQIGDYKFMTISITGLDMFLALNDVEDSKGVENWLSGKIYRRFQLNEVPSPTGSGLNFASRIVELTSNYNKNNKTRPLNWHATEQNCASIVNSIFKNAGVPEHIRHKCGEFKYMDWGEENEIDDSYFI